MRTMLRPLAWPNSIRLIGRRLLLCALSVRGGGLTVDPEEPMGGMTPWERFATVARGGQTDRVPVALIVDSPWLPGYAGIDTLDYFLQPDTWLRINLDLLKRFPDVTWIPGFWAEYGMAAEPSAFGSRVVWHHDQPPAIEPVKGGLAALAGVTAPDPGRHGLMPLILQLY